MADSTDRLSYKFQRLREAIRDAIDTGELARKLPGERALARRFGVNAKTISKALTDLTSEGILVRQVGRGTFVAGQANGDAVAQHTRRFAWLTGAAVQAPFADAMFDMAQSRLREQGHDLIRVTVERDEDGTLPDRCLPVWRLKQLAGVLIFAAVPSRALVADLSRRHLPTVLCNVNCSSLRSSAVVADYAVGAFELTEHLVQLGHSQIQLIVDRRDEEASAQAQRGYLTGMGRYELQPVATLRCTPEDVSALVGRRPEPTAVLCAGSALAAAVRDHVEQHGGSVPQDLSLAALAQPGELATHQSLITSYEVYPDQILDWALQLLVDYAPGTPPRTVLVPGVFNDRGSTQSVSSAAWSQQFTQVVI